MNRHVLRSTVGGAVLLGGMLLAPVMPGAHAQTSTCRSDPKFYLSNGRKVTLAFTLPDTTAVINSVQSIHYDLHIPAGTTVSSVNETGDVFAPVTTWTVYSDAAPNEYRVVASVTTNAAPVATTLSLQIVYQVGKNGGSSVTDYANGTTNQYYVSYDELNGP